VKAEHEPGPGVPVGVHVGSRAKPDRVPDPSLPRVDLPGLAALGDPTSYLAQHSRSFRFAAALMSRPDRARVARVYAWCRYTDNLVDDDVTTGLAERRLDSWLARSWDAYEGRDCGIDLVNLVMAEMAERDIPFAYAHDLVRAMRSDLHFEPYANLAALRVYTYRAAGVVGRWLTELHGVRDRWMLDRATALGEAMQLTNILRDVGEDLGRGRMYLPVSALERHGLSAQDLDAMRRGSKPVNASYRALIDELIAVAESEYDRAAVALPRLPVEFRRAAVVASAVYRGIHGAIRRNGYDNVCRRAFTTRTQKVILATAALVEVAQSRARPAASA
jgi:15-cis-phytoene synthase